MTIITTVRYQGSALTDTFNANRVGPTVLNITGSHKYKQLIQQLVRSLEIRVKTTQTIKNKRKIMNTQTCIRR